MPRLARKNLTSNYLHIIIQGINKEYIFNNDEFKKYYMSILKKNLSDTNILMLAYCIMDNHAHFLLYCENIEEVSKLMQKTNTTYAIYYNKTKKRVGYVFRNRFYSQMILTEQQLFNCVAYIHNNPVKASIVKHIHEYVYSSYKEYFQKKYLISNKSIELLFGSLENYKEIFKEVHNRCNIEDIADIKDDLQDSSEIIRLYTKKHNKKIDEILKNEKLFNGLLLNLRHLGGLSLREMSKIFGISKDKLNKIMNRNL